MPPSGPPRSPSARSHALALLVTLGPATAWGETPVPPPERVVEGNRVVGADMAVAVPEGAAYLGARRIRIGGAYDAEIHAFAEADPFGLIERFYWVQFEAHLPETPGRYDYATSNPETVTLDGVELHVRPGGENTAEGTARSGSDHAAFRGLVEDAGLRLPTWLTTLRLVHLPEPTGRREVMVVYGEGPDALAEAAAEAMAAGADGLRFAEMLADLVADVDARVDFIPVE